MMKIGIDIDDTITNTRELQLVFWKEYVTENKNSNYGEELPTNINGFDDEYIDKFWDIYRVPLAYETTIKDGASRVINKLRSENNEIYIITSRPEAKYDDLHTNLLKWFQKNNIQIDKLYTNIRDKGQFVKDNDIDLLIDDDYNHCKKTIELGKKAIMFNNKNNDIININDWDAIYKYIKKAF